MGVSVAWGSATLDVVPGEEAVLTAEVRNNGQVIDQVSCAVVGAAAAWSVVEPPVLNLYPGDTASVRVHFRPPRAAEPAAGPVPFGLRATSLEDPNGSAVEEGTVEVAPFTELRVTLMPLISRSARKGKHRVDVANLGNVPIAAEIVAVDPDDALTFTVPRRASVVAPGHVSRTKMAAVPREKFWTGAQRERPFEVIVQPDAGDAVTTNATLEHEPIVPRWALAVAVAIVVLALVGAGLWLAVFKPAVTSAATEAARVESAKAAAREADKREAALAAGGGTTGGSASPSPSASPSIDPSKAAADAKKAMTKAVDFRIQTNAAVRTSGFTLTSNSKQMQKPLDVSDVVLQNPLEDVGLLEIRRNDIVLLTFGLQNHRILDQHFAVPMHFDKGDKLYIAVQCQNPAPQKRKCSAAVTISGRTTP